MRSYTYIMIIVLFFAACNPRLSQPQLSTKRDYSICRIILIKILFRDYFIFNFSVI